MESTQGLLGIYIERRTLQCHKLNSKGFVVDNFTRKNILNLTSPKAEAKMASFSSAPGAITIFSPSNSSKT